MPKPIKIIKVNAPKKSDQTDVKTYVELALVPEYRAACETWNNYDINLEILTNPGTVGSLYFIQVNKILKEICPELISRYTIVSRRYR